MTQTTATAGEWVEGKGAETAVNNLSIKNSDKTKIVPFTSASAGLFIKSFTFVMPAEDVYIE